MALDASRQRGISAQAATCLPTLALAVESEYRTFQDHASNACAAAWAIGDYLAKARAQVPHGEWGKWVADRRMSRQFANRCIRIRENYTLVEIHGRSLRDALAEIAGPSRERRTEAQGICNTRGTNGGAVLDDSPPSPSERAVHEAKLAKPQTAPIAPHFAPIPEPDMLGLKDPDADAATMRRQISELQERVESLSKENDFLHRQIEEPQQSE